MRVFRSLVKKTTAFLFQGKLYSTSREAQREAVIAILECYFSNNYGHCMLFKPTFEEFKQNWPEVRKNIDRLLEYEEC